MFASMKKGLYTSQKMCCTEFETTKIAVDSVKFYCTFINKSSAVAEMGDRLATIDMGRKVERSCCGGWGLGPQWVPISHNVGRDLSVYQVAS